VSAAEDGLQLKRAVLILQPHTYRLRLLLHRGVT
jgi:hypothetical protein